MGRPPLPPAAASHRRGVDGDPVALDWLVPADGSLRDGAGRSVRLQGLRRLAAPVEVGEPADELPLIGDIAFGQRCVAESLLLKAQLQPKPLAVLDRRIASRAAHGAYTLLRIDARLWLNGHHLKLAKRYRNQPAVMFGLLGRSALAGRLFAAAVALRRYNARAVIWLPLESAAVALASRLAVGIGWLWDAARPQRPPAGLLRGSLRHPVLLDGWQPQAHSPQAHDRLISLCREGGIGWLAQVALPSAAQRDGRAAAGLAERIVQRAVSLG